MRISRLICSSYFLKASNIGIRGLTLLCKFLLVFFLARFLEPSALGLYGLIGATVGYAIYLVGFDFYTFSTREIIKSPREEWAGMLKNQVAFTVLLYFVFFPLLFFLFIFDVLPWVIAPLFFIILILEHVNQELMRLLIALSRPLLAGLVLFLRLGAWAIVLVGLMAFSDSFRTLEAVLIAWAVGGLLALLIAALYFFRINLTGWRKKIDWFWIKKGVRIALPLLIATLSIRALFTLDRYWINSLLGMDVLGAYVIFISISNVLSAFLDAGVFSFIYPDMIKDFHGKRDDLFRQKSLQLCLHTLLLSLAFTGCAFFLITPFLEWLDRPFYITHLYMFPWILGAGFLYSIGMIPHFILYSQGHDRPLIYSHILGFLIFMMATGVTAFYNPELAVPVGLCMSFLFIFFWKSIAYFRMTPSQYRFSFIN